MIILMRTVGLVGSMRTRRGWYDDELGPVGLRWCFDDVALFVRTPGSPRGVVGVDEQDRTVVIDSDVNEDWAMVWFHKYLWSHVFSVTIHVHTCVMCDRAHLLNSVGFGSNLQQGTRNNDYNKTWYIHHEQFYEIWNSIQILILKLGLIFLTPELVS